MQKAQLTATQRDPISANHYVKQPAQSQHTIMNRACKKSNKKQSKISSMPFASKAWPSCTCIQPPTFKKECRQGKANLQTSHAMQRTTQHTEQLASQRVKHTDNSEQHSTHTYTHKHNRKHNSMQAAEHNNPKGTTHSHTERPNISKSAC